MMHKTLSAAVVICTLSTAAIVDVGGWLDGTLAGHLVNQAAIIAAGVAADFVIPGSGASVIEALETRQMPR